MKISEKPKENIKLLILARINWYWKKDTAPSFNKSSMQLKETYVFYILAAIVILLSLVSVTDSTLSKSNPGKKKFKEEVMFMKRIA